MPDIRPFAALRYAKTAGDASTRVAPPYDVLDEAAKVKLLAADPFNIVAVDLPFTPPKSVGPDEVYARANQTLMQWQADGVMVRDKRPALYPYMQTFEHHGRTYHRRGFICLVKLEEFNTAARPTDIVPHEKTHAGPIEDRLKLTRVTGTQLSPIFGLYSDPTGSIAKTLYAQVGRPEMDATLDGVKHQLWRVTDSDIERQTIDALRQKKAYIADGHHRYTTALAFKHELEKLTGAPLPADHPANFVLFFLVALQDEGCVILPTHRVLAGLSGFDVKRLAKALGPKWDVQPSSVPREEIARFESELAKGPEQSFGLLDGATGKLFTLRLIDADPLAATDAQQSEAWRKLDVAIAHRALIDDAFGKTFTADGRVKVGYTHDVARLNKAVDGVRGQVGLLLSATPLKALEELGKTGETMPQKSTFFYPKIATGMALYPLT